MSDEVRGQGPPLGRRIRRARVPRCAHRRRGHRHGGRVGRTPHRPSADVSSDQSQIAALQQKIGQDGAHVQQLVAISNRAQARLDALDAQVAATEASLVADRRQEAQAKDHLRTIAIESYMATGEGAATLALFSGDTTTLSAQDEYMHLAGDRINAAIDAVDAAVRRTQAANDQLDQAQAQAAATVTQLAADRQAAQGALDHDNALLTGVQGNLQALLVAAAAKRAAALRAQEEAIAAAAPRPPPSGSLPPVTVRPTPGSYANPLRSVNGLNPERIDQGVDYSGFGPIYAIGDGVVLSTANSGWPGGTFIAYRLTDGPANGLVVYAAEDINPAGRVGQQRQRRDRPRHRLRGPERHRDGLGRPRTATGRPWPRTPASTRGGLDRLRRQLLAIAGFARGTARRPPEQPAHGLVACGLALLVSGGSSSPRNRRRRGRGARSATRGGPCSRALRAWPGGAAPSRRRGAS